MNDNFKSTTPTQRDYSMEPKLFKAKEKQTLQSVTNVLDQLDTHLIAQETKALPIPALHKTYSSPLITIDNSFHTQAFPPGPEGP